jgi:hypothetical protein
MVNPIIFISYSWDNDAHINWVLNLAQRLREIGIDVILDKYELKLGHDLLYFMEQSVAKSDKVLLILTPNYKLKAEKREGGVGYEYSIISSRMYELNVKNNKFIPILKYGTKHQSIPHYFESKLYLDMTNEGQFDAQLESLVRDIYEVPKLQKPNLGVKPFYVIEQEFYSKEYTKDLEFLFMERQVVLFLEDRLGKVAICKDEILMKVMKETQYYEDIFTNDGLIDNIKTSPGEIEETRKESGNIIVKTKLDKIYKSGDFLTYSSSCFYIDGHQNQSEYFTVWSGYPTRKLSITVVFPDDRTYIKHKIFKKTNKSDRTVSESPFNLNEVFYQHRKALQVVIQEPDLYDKYRIEWDW